MIFNLLLLGIFTEAIVMLIFEASPLQSIRNKIIEKTPYLYSDEFGYHLLECKYCTSVWIGFLSAILYFFIQNKIIFFFILVIILHRLSNYIHLIFSIIRDLQLNIRIDRNKRG